MSYTTSKSAHLSNRDFFVGTNSYDSTTVPSNEVKITASDAVADDNFGLSVAVGSGRIVVGAPGKAFSAGAAYIYDLDGNEIAKITASDAAADDLFGSVAVGSGRIVVGAGGDDDGGTNAGAVYIFDLNGNEIAKITASDAVAGMSFGSVAVGSGRIVVGAYQDNSLTGSAYIYDLDGNEITKILANDGTSFDFFGLSVAVGSGRIVVGAPYSGVSNSGAVYIFDLNGNQLDKITSSDIEAEDLFGWNVAVGSGRIVVGAITDDDVASTSGSAYIFDLEGNEIAKITASDPAISDQFGYSVTVGSGRIVVGVPFNDNARGSNAGAIYIFDLNGNFITKIIASDGAASDNFGRRVAIGSGKIVVGAAGNDTLGSSAGAAYVYDTPIQKHFLDQLD